MPHRSETSAAGGKQMRDSSQLSNVLLSAHSLSHAAQMFSLDVAFLFAGDMMAYFELFAIGTMIRRARHVRC